MHMAESIHVQFLVFLETHVRSLDEGLQVLRHSAATGVATGKLVLSKDIASHTKACSEIVDRPKNSPLSCPILDISWNVTC